MQLSIKKTVCLLFLICITTGIYLHSQSPDLQFQRYTVDDGLSQGSISCILQDRRGFIWCGTEQGLNRFDGYNFQVYLYHPDDPNSLSSDYILSIHEDSTGSLWIGTKDGGLNKFAPDSGKFSHYWVDPENFDSPGNDIKTIFEDRSGALWLGTQGGGLKKIHRKSGVFTHFPVAVDTPGNIINAIYEDFSGTLWVGTDAGLQRFDREAGILSPAGILDKKVLVIYQDKNRTPWFGTDNGFYRLDRGTGKFIHYNVSCTGEKSGIANIVRVFYEDSLGSFWIGTDFGLHLFDRGKKTYRSYYRDHKNPNTISVNAVRSIYEDRSGALWVGVYGGGLNKLNRTRRTFAHYYGNPDNPDGLSTQDVFALYEDRGGILWIGTYGDGINAFNRKTGEYKKFRNKPGDPESLSGDKIWSICEDREGKIWIGTAEGGLNRFDGETGKFTRYQHHPQKNAGLSHNSVSTIIEDRRGILWIGTDGGLDKRDAQKDEFIHYRAAPDDPNSLVHNNVYIIYEDRRGILWIGTGGGLSIFDPVNETFTSYRLSLHDPESMIHHPIFSFCEDRDRVIWIGTTGGLIKFNRETRAFSRYTVKDGLPNDVIYGILEDRRGNLWMSTNKGLSKFNPRTGKFNNYSAVDGIQASEFCGGSYFKSSRGEMFFGGTNGFNAFFPVTVKDNPYTPPVVITDFQVFNRSVPVGEEVDGRVILEKSITDMETLTLTHHHRIFSFEFSALNYIHTEKNEYAYKMEGIEKSWNHVGKRRFVTYANLAPGDYVFRVKASNNHGVWNEEGVSLRITVKPPFWVTWWFRILIFVFLLFLSFFLHRARTRLILRRKKELEDIVARRTSALRESGEKYRTVVEMAHNGIAIVRGGLVIFRNIQFSGLLGYEDKDIINRPLVQFVLPEKRPDLELILNRSINENTQTGTFETVLKHNDGRNVHVGVSYGNIRYRKQPALLMYFQDIRMRKLLEKERMKTAKLESTRILAGGIAHDFNNLLSIIMGNIELALSDTTPGDDINKLLTSAERTGMKAVDLTRQFITLAKEGSSAKKKEYLQEIIREAVQSVPRDPEESGVTCRFDLPGDLWPVDCDRNQIKQALENIVINSKQAMSGKGILEVAAKNETFDADQIPDKITGRYVCISIADNGAGIPEDTLPKIFDPYFSTREEVTRKGLGLGLAVVHSIIRRHDGTIDVESEPGTGTTVRICLPVSKDSD